jgi:hypothetical protein
LEDYMSIKSVVLRYPLGCKYAIDMLAGCKGLEDLVLVGRFDRTPKSLLPYLEGLRIPSIKIVSPYQPLLIPRELRLFPGLYQGKARWEECSHPSPSGESFKKLIMGPKKTRTEAQTRRATESRSRKVRMKNTYYLIDQISNWN